MYKPVVVIFLLLIPALFIASGFYFEKETLSSLGYVILIFYIIMIIRGKFGKGQKPNK
jgi:hypothetical protein